MPRVARILFPGFPHHVTQRGNNGQDVFFSSEDRRTYLRFLRQRSADSGLSIVGYCLMTNHVHLIVVPATAEATAKAIGRTHFLYTQYVNRLYDRSGHLSQNRFYSCAMDESHAWTALRYVEQNPVRAGAAALPWEYPWSSAALHCGQQAGETRWLDVVLWAQLWTPKLWREALLHGQSPEQLSHLRHMTRTGRPLASEALVGEMERSVGRRLRPLPVGRPKRK